MRRRAAALGLLVALVLGAAAMLGGGDGGGQLTAPDLSDPAQLAAFREQNPAELTVAATGDLLIHGPVAATAQGNGGGSYDFAPMLRPIRSQIRRADLALCHAETPIGAPGGFSSYPIFNAPAELADAVAKTGFDACTTASNHTLDRGQEGIDATLKTLDRAGLEHTGSYASKRARRRPLLLDVAGIKVAVLSYTSDTNGIPLPHPWSVNLLDRERVLSDARRARERGAEAVIVNAHWASEITPEYTPEPSAAQEKLARRLARAPEITALIGQGPHVVQPITRVGGTPVVYSEGNLISNQDGLCCSESAQDGLIALLDVVVDGEGDRVERVRYVPVYVRRPDYAVLPVGEAMSDGDADTALLEASWERTTSVAGRGQGIEPVPKRLPG